MNPVPSTEVQERIIKWMEKEHAPLRAPGMYCPFDLDDTCNDQEFILVIRTTKTFKVERWIGALITRFAKPYKLKLNGELEWSGESAGDFGQIKVVDNKITMSKPKFEWMTTSIPLGA
jgi:hypothetical protein